MTFVDQPDETWTEAPIESDEEDAEVKAMIRACSAQDVEEADDSAAALPWTLSQARAASAEMAIFFHAHQGGHPDFRKSMDAVQGI